MIYILCFLVSIFFAYLASCSRKRFTTFVFSALCVLVLCILGGLRAPYIGTDTGGYGITNYMAAATSPSFSALLNKNLHGEWGYFLITYVVSKTEFLATFNWALFVYQLITVSCFYIGAYRLRKSISLPLFWTAFCFIMYCATYNAMRQLMAASVIFMGFRLLEERRYLRYSLLYVGPTCLLHDSASINIPLLVGVHMLTTSETVIKKNWLKIFITVAMIVILIVAMPLMRTIIRYLPGAARFEYYIDSASNYADSNRWSLSLIMAVELAALMLYQRRAKQVMIPTEGGGANFCQFVLIFSILFPAVVRFLSGRILMYFDSINIMFLATMPRIVRNKGTKAIATVGVVLLSVIYWWRVYVIGGSAEVWPYASIL